MVLAIKDNVDRYNAEKEKVLSLRLKGAMIYTLKKLVKHYCELKRKLLASVRSVSDISERRLLDFVQQLLCINS